MNDVLFLLFRDYILPILGTAVGSLLVWGMSQAVGWIKGKSHDARFHCAMDKVFTLAEAAVLEAEQTVVARLRGTDRWNPHTAAEVKRDVIDVVKRHLGAQGLSEIKGCLGKTPADIDALIDTAVESQIAKLKRAA